jgi:hypothetical protein
MSVRKPDPGRPERAIWKVIRLRLEQRLRWYITYRLSYRDLAAMMAEQGVVVSHTTMMR